jgi:hypothetical protein
VCFVTGVAVAARVEIETHARDADEATLEERSAASPIGNVSSRIPMSRIESTKADGDASKPSVNIEAVLLPRRMSVAKVECSLIVDA